MKIYEATHHLKSVCDGAVNKDGQGFNSFDRKKVDAILSKPKNEINEYILFNTIKKYRGQLKSMGLIENVDDLEFEYYKEGDKVKMESDVILKKQNNSIVIKFDYDKELVDIMRNLPQRKYNPKSKNWLIPAKPKHFKELQDKLNNKKFKVYADFKIKDLSSTNNNKKSKKSTHKPKKSKKVDVIFKYAEPDKLKYDQVIKVQFSYKPQYVNAVKNLPIRYYVKENKEWEVPTFLLDELKNKFNKLNADYKIKGEKENHIKDTEDYDFVTVTNPYDHQKKALEFGRQYKKFLLADEQGLGKTKVAIDLAVSRKEAGLIDKCLIIAGVNSLKHNWVEEIEKHSNEDSRILGSYIDTKGQYKDGAVDDRIEELKNIEERDEFFIITNIETLRRKGFQKVLKKKSKSTLQFTVIDEIHKAKNAQSKQGKGIHYAESEYKLALTGTPIMNNPLEFYNILRWLEIESRNYYQFRNRYAEMGGYGGYQVVGYKNLNELEDLVDKVQLRRKKTEVIDLPPKVRQKEYIEMTGKQKQIYREVESSILSNIDKVKTSPNPLSILTRLRQATTSPEILSSKIKRNPKFDRIKEIIEERANNDDKVLVFSNWTNVINPLFEQLKSEGYNPAIITGEIKDRQKEVNKFQNNNSCKVIVGTIGAMGTGLTLTAGSTVIFTDKPWNMAQQEQAEDRAHRISTTKTVNIISLVAKNTIDEKIEKIIEEKAKYSKGLVDKEQQIRYILGLEEELTNKEVV